MVSGTSTPNDESSSSTASQTDAGPTPPSERIVELDVLRGIGILGILLINIQLIGLPALSVANPTVYGDFSGVNYVAWLVTHIFAEQKFLTIFTLLFGAGILLFTDGKNPTATTARRLHYRRMAWLLVIGISHLLLVWSGDILTAYAICGSLVVLTRNWTRINQTLLGIGLLLVGSLHELSFLVTGEAETAITWSRSSEAIASEISLFQNNWMTQVSYRISEELPTAIVEFIATGVWRTTGVMLLGMALYRYGILRGSVSDETYSRIARTLLPAGIFLTVAGVVYIHTAGWTSDAALQWRAFTYWGSVLMGIGYAALVFRYTSVLPTQLRTAFAAVGRTALSNYLLQSLLATTLFYGFGAGLYGSLTRAEVLLFCLGIWAVQLICSVLWLRRFNYGPCEYAWRTLTYYRVPTSS